MILSGAASPFSNGVVLAAMQSGSGKTALTCMVIAALERAGLSVQPFKAGPDFIDPGYHSRYSKRPCVNLDAWIMGRELVQDAVNRFLPGNVGVLEGVMGLFDGASPSSEEGSTMELARWLNWPVILAVPCEKAGRSIGAAVRGFIEEAGRERIAGLVLNRLNGESHAQYMRDALEYLDVPILGTVDASEDLHWPERHLGLQAETEMSLPSFDRMAELGNRWLDVPKLKTIVKPAPRAEKSRSLYPTPSKRIAVARDEAFHFYYHANLEYLRSKGAELVEFSPIADSGVPSGVDGVIFGGGFPEVFASRLADNQSMRDSIRRTFLNGTPIYAECGGLMVLAENLETISGEKYPMVGAIPGTVRMTSRLSNFGYCRCSGSESNDEVRGHEFHYSRWLEEEERANLWRTTKKYRGVSRIEGYRENRLRASYVHLYFPAAAQVVDELFWGNS